MSFEIQGKGRRFALCIEVDLRIEVAANGSIFAHVDPTLDQFQGTSFTFKAHHVTGRGSGVKSVPISCHPVARYRQGALALDDLRF